MALLFMWLLFIHWKDHASVSSCSDTSATIDQSLVGPFGDTPPLARHTLCHTPPRHTHTPRSRLFTRLPSRCQGSVELIRDLYECSRQAMYFSRLTAYRDLLTFYASKLYEPWSGFLCLIYDLAFCHDFALMRVRQDMYVGVD